MALTVITTTAAYAGEDVSVGTGGAEGGFRADGDDFWLKDITLDGEWVMLCYRVNGGRKYSLENHEGRGKTLVWDGFNFREGSKITIDVVTEADAEAGNCKPWAVGYA
ncbi:hypothetical protein [Streptomyces sp. NPDC059063]|uniref:hypothetical protein n=1 Tax=unclassified Streptomyces TaxID=2593676 RepID=UPI00367B90F5